DSRRGEVPFVAEGPEAETAGRGCGGRARRVDLRGVSQGAAVGGAVDRCGEELAAGRGAVRYAAPRAGGATAHSGVRSLWPRDGEEALAASGVHGGKPAEASPGARRLNGPILRPRVEVSRCHESVNR